MDWLGRDITPLEFRADSSLRQRQPHYLQLCEKTRVSRLPPSQVMPRVYPAMTRYILPSTPVTPYRCGWLIRWAQCQQRSFFRSRFFRER